MNDLRNQIIKDNLNITLITIEGFSQFKEGHPRVQLENLQVGFFMTDLLTTTTGINTYVI